MIKIHRVELYTELPTLFPFSLLTCYPVSLHVITFSMFLVELGISKIFCKHGSSVSPPECMHVVSVTLMAQMTGGSNASNMWHGCCACKSITRNTGILFSQASNVSGDKPQTKKRWNSTEQRWQTELALYFTLMRFVHLGTSLYQGQISFLFSNFRLHSDASGKLCSVWPRQWQFLSVVHMEHMCLFPVLIQVSGLAS